MITGIATPFQGSPRRSGSSVFAGYPNTGKFMGNHVHMPM